MSATWHRASRPSSEALRAALADGARAAPWLQRHLGISQPSLSRVVAEATACLPELRRFGRGKSTLYALAGRASASIGAPDSRLTPPQPVWFESRDGTRHRLGDLHALVRDEWVFAPAGTGTPGLSKGPPAWLALLRTAGEALPGRFGVGEFVSAPVVAAGAPATAPRASIESVPPPAATDAPAIRERLQDLAVAAELAVDWLRAANVPVEPVDGWPLAAVQPGLPARIAEALPQVGRRGSLGAGSLQSLRWLVDFAASLGDALHADHLRFGVSGAAARLPIPPWPGLPAAQPPAWRPPPQAQVVCVAGLFPRAYLPQADGDLPGQALELGSSGAVRAARHAAERYWRQLAQDGRVSFGFRLIAAGNARRLAPVPVKNRN